MVPGFCLHDELEWLTKAKFTPLEALQTATINPARFLGREKTQGSVDTGKRADLLIVDDPIKNMQEADSHAMRTKIIEWYHSVATSRLAPGAGVVVIQTRWHPEDLSGQLLKHDRELPPELREWHYINIPAVSHPALPDALGRPPGVALESARGRTREDFAKIERSVGKRVWNALYQGAPTPPEGGLFAQAWFEAIGTG